MTTRLLAGVRADGRALSPDEHLLVHGPLPTMPSAELLAAVDAVAVRGRGGAGFPMARKLRATADAVARSGRAAVVVANGTEGESASCKDAALLQANPQLVLDGVVLAARAVGTREAYVCVHPGAAAQAVRAALAVRPRASDGGVRIGLSEVPARYVSGEAGALVRHLSGGPALPSTRLAPLAQRGLRGRPTLVHNVETLAQLACLARIGADAYASTGTCDEPGTMLVTVRTPAASPVVVELPIGTTIAAALASATSTPVAPQAVLVGGYYGSWLRLPQALDVPLSHAGLRAAGGSLGAGLVMVLPADACGLAATADVVRYLAAESAGQCGPCVNGLPAIAGAFDQLVRGGAAAPAALAQLSRWCGLVIGRGACSHPDGVVGLVRSALTAFSDDVAAHLRMACGRPAGAHLAVPA